MLTRGRLRRPEDRLTYAFRRATARTPHRDRAAGRWTAASNAIARPSGPIRDCGRRMDPARREPACPPGIDPVELAAYTATASVILNLDETITRE